MQEHIYLIFGHRSRAATISGGLYIDDSGAHYVGFTHISMPDGAQLTLYLNMRIKRYIIEIEFSILLHKVLWLCNNK